MASTHDTLTLNSVDAIINALGGTEKAAAELRETENRVAVWKHRGAFPANRFMRHTAVLRNKGIAAPPSLWGQQDESSAAPRARSA
ncbi:hypothetical protein [Oricola sp.]|uniref:hypothetical protein n=1 Tax=Oricola sp. TaxID=1979950 RepID=UPI003BAAAD12